MNSCTFIGRLVREPELKEVAGKHLLDFSVAISRKYKTKSGEKAEETSFLDFQAWDSGAETIAKYFKKGDPIILHASAKQDRWQVDGQTRSRVIFRVNTFEFVPSTGGGGKKPESDDAAPTSSSPPVGSGDTGDEIPF